MCGDKEVQEKNRQARMEPAEIKQLWPLANQGKLAEVQKAAAAGVDLRAIHRSNGDTLLHAAALAGHLDLVRWLVKEGDCSPNAQNNEGNSVLHFAAQGNHLPVVRCLLEECQADVNEPNSNGDTVLHWSAFRDHPDVVRYLLTRPELNVNARDRYSRTALQSLAGKGELELVKELLKRGADPNAVDRDGRTVLMEAAWSGHVAVVEALLAGGAKLVADEDGRDALDVLMQFRNNGMFQVESLVPKVRQLRERYPKA